MPIAAQCQSCSTRIKVRDELAGKRVKCPKCAEPLKIPNAKKAAPGKPAASPSATGGGGYGLAPAHNPMLDLLDEAGVESTPSGPVCNNCGTELSPMAIICVECGFNNDTGKQLETTSVRESGQVDEGMTDAEKLLARAEQEIDETPVSASEQDFGDGADSLLIAAVAVIGLLILAGAGVTVIFVMDKIGENINTAWISLCGSVAIYAFCAIWISFVAFRAKPLHGLGCVLSAGIYCIIFGFMQGKALLMPTLICIFAILIGLVSWAVGANSDSAMLIQNSFDIVTIV